MDPLIASVIITWLLMRAGRVVKNEWQHSRDTHGNDLARQHPDWSPGRVRRNARRRARADWLTELRDGFPTLRQTLAEDRLLARTVREERRAAGEDRMRGLRERLDAAVRSRDAGTVVTAGDPAGRVTVHGPCPGPADEDTPPLPADGVPRLRPVPVPGQVCRVCLKPGSDADPLVPAGIGVAHRSHIATGEAMLAAARDHAATPHDACPWCHGSGNEPLDSERCGWCEGSGKAPGPRSPAPGRKMDDSSWLEPHQERCEGCGGTGANADGTDACPVCRGWGSAPPDADSPRHPHGTICRACGHPGTPEDPVISGDQIHRSHVVEQQASYQDALARQRGVPAADPAEPDDEPFPEPGDDNWPTGIPHRRSGDAPSPAASTETGTPEMPTAFMTAGELERYRATGRFVPGASTATNGGTVTDMQIDTALENADTPHEAMQGAFRQIGAKAAQFAQAASDDLAAAAAVHGMDRDPQTMADIAALADHAQALQAQANAAATGLASRHADGAEYHGSGQDANASAFRPS